MTAPTVPVFLPRFFVISFPFQQLGLWNGENLAHGAFEALGRLFGQFRLWHAPTLWRFGVARNVYNPLQNVEDFGSKYSAKEDKHTLRATLERLGRTLTLNIFQAFTALNFNRWVLNLDDLAGDCVLINSAIQKASTNHFRELTARYNRVIIIDVRRQRAFYGAI